MQQVTYRYHIGDILRLRHTSPLAAAGDYVLLNVDDIVCLGRLVHSTRGRRISRKRVYLLITDLCLFEETGRSYHEWTPLPTTTGEEETTVIPLRSRAAMCQSPVA